MSSAAMTSPAAKTTPRKSSEAQPSRTPLSVVPARQTRRSRVSTAVIGALALAGALIGILFLNIHISSGQYRLTELTIQERALTQENEALTQDIEANAAPQNLAARANDLGMVQPDSVGVVELGEGDVVADSSVADEAKAQEIMIPPANMKGSKAANDARLAAQERTEKRAEEEAKARAAEREAAQREREASTLNGGSIPGPTQRSPGQ